MSTPYGKVGDAFEATANFRSLPKVGRRVEAAQEELRAAAEELDGVEPPEEIAEPHEELIEGLTGYAEDLGELRQAAEDGNGQAIQEFNRNVRENEFVQRIAEAAEEMIQRGYRLGPLQPE